MCDGGRALSSEQTFSCTKAFLSFLHAPQTKTLYVKRVLPLPNRNDFGRSAITENVKSPLSHLFCYFYG